MSGLKLQKSSESTGRPTKVGQGGAGHRWCLEGSGRSGSDAANLGVRRQYLEDPILGSHLPEEHGVPSSTRRCSSYTRLQ